MITLRKLIVCGVFEIYTYVSKLIFDRVYNTTKTVIDEAFHLPQGLAYCNYNFETWDPKITTLPGLYLISTIFLGPLNLCDVYWLRLINFSAASINLVLFYIWFSLFNKKMSTTIKLLSSLNLSLLPPLYFFSNLYYTDVLSLSSVLLLLMFSRINRHFLASVSGLISVMIRQTNIIWVLMIFGEYFWHHCLRLIYLRSDRRKKNHWKTNCVNIYKTVAASFTLKRFKKSVQLQNLSSEEWTNTFSYGIIIIAFGAFLIRNGGVVIGDKSAHTAVIHIPQLFYFSLFCIVFSWTHLIPFIIPFIKAVINNLLLTTVLVVLMALIVYFNTLVHPYLLADNRHYTFYIWTRFYHIIPIFRYIMIGPYLFGLYSLYCILYINKDIAFAAMYITCTTLVLILQKMIEVRYFLVPFILCRLHFQYLSTKLLIIEFVFYCFVNAITMSIFFEKDIYWNDFDYAQKLIW